MLYLFHHHFGEIEGQNQIQNLELSKKTNLLQAWSRNRMKGSRRELMGRNLMMVLLLMLLICMLAGMVVVEMIQSCRNKEKKLTL